MDRPFAICLLADETDFIWEVVFDSTRDDLSRRCSTSVYEDSYIVLAQIDDWVLVAIHIKCLILCLDRDDSLIFSDESIEYDTSLPERATWIVSKIKYELGSSRVSETTQRRDKFVICLRTNRVQSDIVFSCAQKSVLNKRYLDDSSHQLKSERFRSPLYS